MNAPIPPSAAVPETSDGIHALLRQAGEDVSFTGTPVVLPLHVNTHTVTAGGAIVIPDGADVAIHDTGDDETVIVVGIDATLHYITAATGSTKPRRTVYAMRGARVDWIDAMTGDETHASSTVLLAGEGADAKYRGVFLGVGKERYASVVRMLHLAPRTSSHMLTRAALMGASNGAYRGLIRVVPGAHGCDAYQRADALLIGDAARMDALPVLEIGDDDVRCSHGVAIGRVDDERLFYLRSRGLPAADARALIVQGFFDQVLISMGAEGRALQESFAKRLAADELGSTAPRQEGLRQEGSNHG